jgi:hypothetical protein
MTVSTTTPGMRGATSNELLLCLHAMFPPARAPIVVERKRDLLNLYTESDFVVATMAGQVYEFEIKVSRRDFLKDADKLRNRIYSDDPSIRPGRKPNRFWYVTSAGIVGIEDIPSFAGWMEWEDGKLVQRRNAPLLQRECHGVEVLMYLARAMRNRK